MPDLEDLVGTIGGLAWVSGRLFELEGRWAESMAHPGAVVHLAEHSRHHGWHAELWRDALPDSPALAAADHIVAPPGWERAMALTVADGAIDAGGDAARLAALYRGLVPRLAGALADLHGQLAGPADASISRVLGLVTADVDADLRGGGGHLAATLRDDDAIGSASSATLGLDQAFRIT